MFNIFIPYSIRIHLLLFGCRHQAPKKIHPTRALFKEKQRKYFIRRKHGKR